jgi:hypothetical protein
MCARVKGLAGYRPADKAKQGNRKLARDVKEAKAQERGTTYHPTKPTK